MKISFFIQIISIQIILGHQLLKKILSKFKDFKKFEEQNNLQVNWLTSDNKSKNFTSLQSVQHILQFDRKTIKDAKLVFIHSSTTKHIAAAYKKPLIF